MTPDFPVYETLGGARTPAETVRAQADDKIAPTTAATDEPGEFPQNSCDALVQADPHAVHIPEAYEGAGADALATVIVIEEVARACASSSLIPALNKLGTVPILLSGSEDLKKRYLAPVPMARPCSHTRDYPVERMMRDAKITQIYAGTDQIQRMVMAGRLLK